MQRKDELIPIPEGIYKPRVNDYVHFLGLSCIGLFVGGFGVSGFFADNVDTTLAMASVCMILLGLAMIGIFAELLIRTVVRKDGSIESYGMFRLYRVDVRDTDIDKIIFRGTPERPENIEVVIGKKKIYVPLNHSATEEMLRSITRQAS